MPDVIVSNFQPRRRLISDVTNALSAEVTTTDDHGYEVGQVVRVIVPRAYGMEIDYKEATVLTVPSTTAFTVDIDTSLLSDYVTPTEPPSFTNAQIVPVSGLVRNNTSITG